MAGETEALDLIGDLPSNWKVARFGDVLEGGTRNGIYKPKEFHGNGAKVVNMGELFANPRLRDVPMRRVQLSDAELEKSCLNTGDLLFARRSLVAEGAGKCIVVAEVKEPTTFESSIIRARPNPKAVDSLFLYYLFNSPYGAYVLLTIRRQVAVSGITGTDLVELPIPIPPLAEQKAIAAVLGALDDKIELNRQINATLEAMARALFQSWFVDFDPVRAKMEGREPSGMDAETAALFPDGFEGSELGPIPRGWEVKTADEVSTVGIGKTPPRMERHWFSENPADVPWMSIRDLGSAGVFISHTSEFLTAEAVEKFRVKRIPDNTVVLSFKLTMGRVAITDGEKLSNEAIAHFRLNPETTFGSAYLYCYLKGFGYDQLGSTSSIATAINSDMVRGMRVLVPPKGIAEAFERTVKPLFTQMKNIHKQSRTLATLRDTLLPKLLSGELRVNDISLPEGTRP
jgi:type I restriction enzyme S subunit